jgi:hypothetical protein
VSSVFRPKDGTEPVPPGGSRTIARESPPAGARVLVARRLLVLKIVN